MEFILLYNVENWWLGWVHGMERTVLDFYHSQLACERIPGGVSVMLAGLLLGLFVEVRYQKNQRNQRKLLASYRTNLTPFLCSMKGSAYIDVNCKR